MELHKITDFLSEHWVLLYGGIMYALGALRDYLEGRKERRARRNFEKYQQIGENIDAGLKAGLHAEQEAEK